MRIENMNTTMKTFLLGTTAVVGLGLLIPAPVFAAEPITLSIDGTVRVEAFFVEQDDDAVFGRNTLLKLDDAGFNLQARGVADNGLRYGAAIKFNTDATGGAISVDERALWFEGGWGRLELGNDDDASSGMTNHGGDLNSGASGYDGGPSTAFDFNSIEQPGAGIAGGGDATKITYFTPRVNGIQVGVSYTPDTNADGTSSISDLDAAGSGVQDQIALGINFVQSFDDVGIRLSYVMVNGDSKLASTKDTNNWAIGAQADFGNVSVAAGYGDNGNSGQTGTVDDRKWADFTVRYSDGPMTVSAGFLSTGASTGVAGEADDDLNIFSVGTAYTVADGLSVYAGFDIIDVNRNGTASDNEGTLLTLGTKMSF